MITLVSSGERIQAYDDGRRYGAIRARCVGPHGVAREIQHWRELWTNEQDPTERRYLFGVLSGLRGE